MDGTLEILIAAAGEAVVEDLTATEVIVADVVDAEDVVTAMEAIAVMVFVCFE